MFSFIGIGAKLLGIGSSIKKFFLDNWKIIVPILLVIGLLWYHNSAIKKAYREGEVAGISIENKRTNALIKVQDNKNRVIEKSLNEKITKKEEENKLLRDKRVKTEIVYQTNIETLIKDRILYKDCIVDADVIKERNMIRSLGPKGVVE